jgi:hypothetical protein
MILGGKNSSNTYIAQNVSLYPRPLSERSLMHAYRAPPAHQQNDHIGSLCFTLAKQETTKQKNWIKSWMNSIAGAWK